MKPFVLRSTLLTIGILLGSQWAVATLCSVKASESEHESENEHEDSHDDHGSSDSGGSGSSGSGGSGSSGSGGSGSSGSGGSGSSGSGSSGSSGSDSGGGGGTGGGGPAQGATVSARPAILTPEEKARDIVKSGLARPFATVLPTVRQAQPGDILNILLMPSPQGYIYEVWVLAKDGRNLAVRVDAVRNKLIDIRSR
jgi:hypothetical protein